MEINVKDLTELKRAASEMINAYPQNRVFLFYGAMGTGKTTLINELCQQLGVHDHTSSPTFSIVNEYASDNGPIFHFDFYRLKNESEAFDFGYEEYFYSGNYCFVEWPEKIPNLLPTDAIEVNITLADFQSRTISFEKK
ncbi:tRNA (adenosine(37)-N6)-threonylcarbamoyltransferase complex ATPase subunit type 1 TsaE [Sphingobacterium faecale]|uniref:tRNA threonylcarbamoyladenosine biosynthesis protein TsaE n=1 Tax=Sphingobacterium faecale TaxID=2803775 RepID=A0ABS1R4P2_9SPHI|nr:tRNA (adenosine(37)-N6)-threonylcarbamoyltransferase complex ATPase subunit type 1 TsaE [Sphingobacterium faecale]MBL1409686.1 tRNA (adenosine(37)-N6)-threonylcarbamoyltransferase complex ATPase subunit type 1 TsaE [Sphingobacterium faecale]